MIFGALHDAAKRGELLLVNGGMCHYHLRSDGQVTIREIIVTSPGQGIGRALVQVIARIPSATSIFAKCPAGLEANGWYKHLGFECEGIEQTKTGKELKLWRLPLP